MAQNDVVSADVGDKESSDFKMSVDFHGQIDFMADAAKGIFCVIDVTHYDIPWKSFHWDFVLFDQVLMDEVSGGTTIHKSFHFDATIPPTHLEFNWQGN